jgi:NAD(P)-dependent dehydrogenase (short-subunit alcohol dehydrogenase family)
MSDPGPLAGRTALVSGGATLFGRAVVGALATAGASVFVLDVDADGAKAAAAEIPGATAIAVDLTDDDALAAAVSHAVAVTGRIDVLVNLACSYDDAGPDTTRAQWLHTLNVNVASAALLAAAVRPHLAEAGGGSIVNVSSVSSKVAQTGRWTYPASKAALVQLTRSMAMDYASDGIRVNSVSPGWTWSAVMDALSGSDQAKTDRVAAPFHLAGRVADPEDVAAVIVFLAGDAARAVTGADWAADGGYSAMGPEQAVPAIPLLME